MTRYRLTMKFPSRSGEINEYVHLSDDPDRLAHALYRDRICTDSGKYYLLRNCEWFKLTP